WKKIQRPVAGPGRRSVRRSKTGFGGCGAVEKTRTSTPFRELAPQASASTNSATTASPTAASPELACPIARRLPCLAKGALGYQIDIHGASTSGHYGASEQGRGMAR